MTTGGACGHIQAIESLKPTKRVCEDCVEIGGRWVHLRTCQECGVTRCCDNSPNRHATAHAGSTDHPIIRSYEPGEDWWWCYPDESIVEVPGAPPAPSHP